ncbi:hypothetical protein ACFE04_027576 [Oxalis oulophora]
MDRRGSSASSHYLEDNRLPVELQVGFWRSANMRDHQDGMVQAPGRNMISSSPMQKFASNGALSKETSVIGNGGEERIVNLPGTSWNSMDHSKSWSNMHMQQPPSFVTNGNQSRFNGIQRESSLFSSSLSDIFSKKLELSGKNPLLHQTVRKEGPHFEEEPLESLKEIEAKTIGNLLPDEDDLFSGVVDDLGPNNVHNTNSGDDLEDFDLFSSVGGMELEGDDHLIPRRRNSDYMGGVSVGEHPRCEQPSRTLFVSNIDSNVEDSELKRIFQHFGEIRTLYTAGKIRGFVMIAYYDIRAARNAVTTLQRKPLRDLELDIHYSNPKENPSEKDVNEGTLVVFNLDSSVSTDELRQIFSAYGEVMEVSNAISETPHKHHHKFVEFYDIRAAEIALKSLNKSDIAGKRIKVEVSRSGGAKRCYRLQNGRGQNEAELCQSPFVDFSSGHQFSPGGISSSCMVNGSSQVNSSHNIALSDLHQAGSVPNNFSSPARVPSMVDRFGANHSLNEMKFGNQNIPNFHPHSFPEYSDGLGNDLPFNSMSPVPDMASNIASMMKASVDNRHIQGLSSNGSMVDQNGGFYESSGNGSSSGLHGSHFAWNNNPNLRQQRPTGPMMWPSNSPTLVNGIHTHRIPHGPGFSRVPLMLNATSPSLHHIGSAPTIDHSLWDRRHAYPRESPETSAFHLGSLGSLGFPGTSPMEIASRNLFSSHGGNGVDISKSSGIPSSQQMCQMFPGRNPMISMPSSFDSPGERVRNLTHRRSESNSNNADKKQYELDLDRILHGDDKRTTLMIKNIPNKYTSKMLLAAIDEYCRGTYDFIYLPIDFKNKCNVGYAFINMINPTNIIPFYKAFNGKKWEKFNSEKVASLAYARIQGKNALVAHFQNSSLMNEDKRCRPILFHTDGPNAGDQEPFPTGAYIRSRPGKNRASGNEENHFHQVNSPNADEFSNGSDSSKESD